MEFIQGAIGIVLFFVILGLLVLIHEVGHFITARMAGIRVHEFGIGFPPRARVLRSEGETLFTLNWLPIGGFVKLEGEDGDSDDPRSFTRAPLLVKEIVLVAGVAMNFALAFVLMSAIAFVGDDTLGIRFQMVQPDSPAAAAGLLPDDTIVSIDGRPFSAFEEGAGPLDFLRANAGRTVSLDLDRADATSRTVTVKLRSPAQIDDKHGPLGIENVGIVTTGRRIPHDAVTSVRLGADRTVRATGLIIEGLGELANSIVTQPTQPPPAEGPVGIAAAVSQVFWQSGPIATLYLAAILSANLGLVNVLPFPPLDGGRMLIVALKRFVGKRVSLRAEQLTYLVGFAFLFAFLIWITVFDVARLGGAIR